MTREREENIKQTAATEDSKKLKICVVGSSKYFFSGLTAHTIFLSNSLSENNDVSVILLRKLLPQFIYPGKKHLNKENYTIKLNDNLDVYEKLDWNSPLSWIKASMFLKKHQPDAIIMLWWTSSVAHMQLILALTNKLFVKSKLILEIHEIVDPLEEKSLPIRLYAKITLKMMLKSADAFTIHSTEAKEKVAKTHHIDRNKIFVKPFGLYEEYKTYCDVDLVRKEFGVTEKFVILSFGSIRKYKGISHLVKAFSLLPEWVAADSRLIIAGEDWGDDNELKELIDNSPYKSKITLDSHFIDDKDIPKYFSISDVVVLPYLRSCGSGVAHIAMSYGKAILTSDIESMRECLAEYSGAKFASVADYLEIKQKILDLYDCKIKGDPLIFNAPRDSWKAINAKYAEIIGNIRAKTGASNAFK